MALRSSLELVQAELLRHRDSLDLPCNIANRPPSEPVLPNNPPKVVQELIVRLLIVKSDNYPLIPFCLDTPWRALAELRRDVAFLQIACDTPIAGGPLL